MKPVLLMRHLEIIKIDHSRGSESQTTYGMMEKIIGQFKFMCVYKGAKLKNAREKPVFITKNVNLLCINGSACFLDFHNAE